MRILMHQWLTNNPELTAIIPADRWIQSGALDRPPVRPFAVVGFTSVPRSTIGSARPRLTIWVHDDRGSYARIDEVIAYLQKNLPEAPPLEDATSRIVDIRWEATSPDLTDDAYSTNVRNAEFSLTGRK